MLTHARIAGVLLDVTIIAPDSDDPAVHPAAAAVKVEDLSEKSKEFLMEEVCLVSLVRCDHAFQSRVSSLDPHTAVQVLRLRQDKELIAGQNSELSKQMTEATVQQGRLETQLNQLTDVLSHLEQKAETKYQARGANLMCWIQ